MLLDRGGYHWRCGLRLRLLQGCTLPTEDGAAALGRLGRNGHRGFGSRRGRSGRGSGRWLRRGSWGARRLSGGSWRRRSGDGGCRRGSAQRRCGSRGSLRSRRAGAHPRSGTRLGSGSGELPRAGEERHELQQRELQQQALAGGRTPLLIGRDEHLQHAEELRRRAALRQALILPRHALGLLQQLRRVGVLHHQQVAGEGGQPIEDQLPLEAARQQLIYE